MKILLILLVICKNLAIANEELLDAVQNDNIEKVRQLLKSGVNPNTRGKNEDKSTYNLTPLMLAAQYSPRALKELLNVGADPNQSAPNGRVSTLHIAAKYQHEAVSLLLEKRVDVNQLGTFGTSALMLAAKHQPKAVPFLLEKGADVNNLDVHGYDALMLAAVHHPEVVPLLVSAGANINHVNEEGESALMIAAEYNPEATIYLLGKVADPCILTYEAFGNAFFRLREKLEAYYAFTRESFYNSVCKDGLSYEQALKNSNLHYGNHIYSKDPRIVGVSRGSGVKDPGVKKPKNQNDRPSSATER